jgi:hypothetical protein
MAHKFDKEDRRRLREKRRAKNEAAVNPFNEWMKMSPRITTVDVPDKLAKSSSHKPSLKNPLAHSGATEEYAGHPAHYPKWRTDWKRRLLAMEDVLTRNGKKGLQLMYSAKINGYFNFFIIGANGDFVWRKQQSSSYGSNHVVYIGGDKEFATYFEDFSKKKQDKLISAI